MSELEILRNGFIAFLDGLWWSLRNTVGALSMYEGYIGGFKQLGQEAAEKLQPRDPKVLHAQLQRHSGRLDLRWTRKVRRLKSSRARSGTGSSSAA